MDITPLPKKPKIKEYFDVLSCGDGKILLVSEEEVLIRLKEQSGRKILERLFQHLDGSCEISAIAERMRLETGISEEQTTQLLHKLNQSGVLEEGACASPAGFSPEELQWLSPQLNFFSRYTDRKHANQELLKNTQIAIVGSGDVSNMTGVSLAKAGIGRLKGISLGASALNPAALREFNPWIVVDEAAPASWDREGLEACVAGSNVLIAALDRNRPALLEILNEICLDRRIPWLMCLNSGGLKGVMGPFFVPGDTPCWRCLNLRLKSNMDYWRDYRVWEEWSRGKPFSPVETHSNLGPFSGILGGMAALEAVKHLLRLHPQTYGQMMSVNLDIKSLTEFGFHLHTFYKIPNCPACGAGTGASELQ